MQANPSIVVVTSSETILSRHSDFVNFFRHLNTSKKNLIIYSHQPVNDYTPIKQIPADEMVILYQKDFLPFNFSIKPNVSHPLKQSTYDILIHFNTHQHLRNTYLISKTIPATIKISDTLRHSPSFSIIIHNSEKYLSDVIIYMNKITL
ncbi:MAG: hypothetical protein KatS3mg028_0049 [Bacteroidia bacterium]|nr:MAG: hypothetical protein KatS3mg028_0049 [Bacteroidia bacterium]